MKNKLTKETKMSDEIAAIYMDAAAFLSDHPDLELSPDNEGDLEIPETLEMVI